MCNLKQEYGHFLSIIKIMDNGGVVDAMVHHIIGDCTIKNKFDVLPCLEIMEKDKCPIHLHPSSM